MNRDLALKYQAFVDGELPEREARQLAETLERDTEAQAIVAELRATKTLLAGNEPELRLPEALEFYWSKIQREIQRLEAEPPAVPSTGWFARIARWRQFLAPAAGVAVIAFLAIAAIRFYNTEEGDQFNQHLAEIENLSEHATSYSFRSITCLSYGCMTPATSRKPIRNSSITRT